MDEKIDILEFDEILKMVLEESKKHWKELEDLKEYQKKTENVSVGEY